MTFTWVLLVFAKISQKIIPILPVLSLYSAKTLCKNAMISLDPYSTSAENIWSYFFLTGCTELNDSKIESISNQWGSSANTVIPPIFFEKIFASALYCVDWDHTDKNAFWKSRICDENINN